MIPWHGDWSGSSFFPIFPCLCWGEFEYPLLLPAIGQLCPLITLFLHDGYMIAICTRFVGGTRPECFATRVIAARFSEAAAARGSNRISTHKFFNHYHSYILTAFVICLINYKLACFGFFWLITIGTNYTLGFCCSQGVFLQTFHFLSQNC